MDAQWRELEDKEETFKANFIRFNKFVRENEEKRARAQNKIKDDINRIEKKDLEITLLQEKYDDMMKVRLHMEGQIKKHKTYEDYLYNVVEESTEFKDVDDILSRYEALIDARQQLIERQEKDLSALENAHSDMVCYCSTKPVFIKSRSILDECNRRQILCNNGSTEPLSQFRRTLRPRQKQSFALGDCCHSNKRLCCYEIDGN